MEHAFGLLLNILLEKSREMGARVIKNKKKVKQNNN